MRESINGTSSARATLTGATRDVDPIDWEQIVPSTCEKLSYFIGKTRAGLLNESFTPGQLEDITTALADAGHSLRDSHALAPGEWFGDKKFGDTSYYDLALSCNSLNDLLDIGVPMAEAHEIFETSKRMRRESQYR